MLLVVAAGAAGLWFRQRPAVPATNLRLVSTFSGDHWGASFSPDGRFIAFLMEADGVAQVWVKNLAEGDPLQVTFGDVPVQRLTWSPLNDGIVFSRFRAGLWSVPPLGGAARRVLEFGAAPTLSADGKLMVFTRGMAIWMANADGTDAREVPGVPKAEWNADRWPVVSPDGQTIAFFHPSYSPVSGDIWVISAAGGEPRQITFDSAETASPAWTPDGRSIIYSSARGGGLTLWRVAATGGTPVALTTGAGEDTEPAVSSDGRTLLYGTQRKVWSFVVKDLATGQDREVMSRRTPLVFPALSPGGDRIAFMQPADAGAHLFVVSPDGRDVSQVTRVENEQNLAPQFSADGKSLYFYRMHPSKSFRRIPVDGGTSAELAAWDFQRERSAHVDRLDRAVVYEVGEGDAINPTPSTRVRDLGSGREHALGAAIRGPRWAPDSRTIYGTVISPDPAGDPWNRWNVMACPADGQPCRALVRGFYPIPSSDGSRLFYLRDTGAARRMRELWMVNPDGANAQKIADIGPFAPDGYWYDVSPNQILFTRFSASRRELWAADLK
jgi:Tol biopolymer transport system component